MDGVHTHGGGTRRLVWPGLGERAVINPCAFASHQVTHGAYGGEIIDDVRDRPAIRAVVGHCDVTTRRMCLDVDAEGYVSYQTQIERTADTG